MCVTAAGDRIAGGRFCAGVQKRLGQQVLQVRVGGRVVHRGDWEGGPSTKSDFRQLIWLPECDRGQHGV